MVVIDAAILTLMISPEAGIATDAKTGKPVEHVEARLSFLIQTLEKSKSRIIIPTPVLSEVLVRRPLDRVSIINRIRKSVVFRIADFDTLAAIEVAEMTKSAIDAGDKRDGGDGTWAKIKYDRQILAIAIVHRAGTIYSDDLNIQKFGRAKGLIVIGITDLPLPPEEKQIAMDFQHTESTEKIDEEGDIAEDPIEEAELDNEEIETLAPEGKKDEPETEEGNEKPG